MTTYNERLLLLMKGRHVLVSRTQLETLLKKWPLSVSGMSNRYKYEVWLAPSCINIVNTVLRGLKRSISTFKHVRCSSSAYARLLVDSIGHEHCTIEHDPCVVSTKYKILPIVGDQLSFVDDDTNAVQGLVVAVDPDNDSFTIFSNNILQVFTTSNGHRLR